MERKKAEIIACIVLSVFYLVGRVGMALPAYASFFAGLTPLNLLLTAMVVFAFRKSWNLLWVGACLFVFGAALLLEIAGVKTGYPFGTYSYGSILGPQVLGVPLIIGLNWLVLVYTAVSLVEYLPLKPVLKRLLAAVLLAVLDLALEPFAIRFGLWNWTEQTVPPQNYLSWLVAGFLFSAVLGNYVKQNANRVASFVYVLQLVFFLSFLL